MNPVRVLSTIAVCVTAVLASTAPADAATKPSGGSWSSGVAVSPVNQPDPTRGSQSNDVAVNAAGTAIAAWDQFTYTSGGNYTVGVAVQEAGHWSTPLTLSGGPGFSMTPRVAAGADGTLAVSWTYQTVAGGTRSAQVAVRAAGTSTWSISTVSVAGADASVVSVAVSATGEVTAVWQSATAAGAHVQSAVRPAGGSWSAPVTLDTGTAGGVSPSLALDRNGDAAVAYVTTDWTSWVSYASYTFRSATTGQWTAPRVVSEMLSVSAGYVTSPRVVLDANGLATVAYFANGVEATRQGAVGVWTVPVAVLTSPVLGASFTSVDLAGDDAGAAVLTATIFDPTVNVDRSSAYVARSTSAGVWTPQLRLTDPSVPVDAYAGCAAMSPDGALVLVGWIDHYHGVVQVARWSGTNWLTSTIGRGTAWASFQEVMSLDAASATSARAVWKNAKSGTQTIASTYRG